MTEARPTTDNSTTPIFDTQTPNIEMDTITQKSNDVSNTTQPKIEAEVQPEGLPTPEYLQGLPLYLVLLGATLTLFLIQLDQSVMVPAIPKITNSFNSLKDIGWYASSFMLAIASLQPLTGKIYQFYNTKIVFLTALGLFELGSLLCGLANSSNMLIIGRAIAGSGASGLTIGILSILASSSPLEKRPLYLGIMMGIATLGTVAGPVIGGLFAQYVTWRLCFYINLPFGLLTLTTLSFSKIPSSKLVGGAKNLSFKEQFHRLDMIGFLIFVPAVTMLLLSLSWGGVTYPWSSPTIIGLFCGSGVVSIMFVIWERRKGEEAMIPLSLLKRSVVVSASITASVSQGALLLTTFYLTIWFQAVKEASPTMSGVYYLPTVGAMMVGAIGAGALTSKLGYYTPFAIIGTALSSVASGLFSTLTPTSSTGLWIGYQILSGSSRGMTAQQGLVALQAILPESQLPIGNAWLMFCQMLGSSIFISAGQALFANELVEGLGKFAEGVNVKAVLEVGVTGFRGVVSEEMVDEVVRAYSWGVTRVFFLGAAGTAVGFLSSWGMGWTNLKAKKALEDGDMGASVKAGEEKV